MPQSAVEVGGLPYTPVGHRSLADNGKGACRPGPSPAPPPPPAAAARPAATPLSEAKLFRRKSLDELNAKHPLSDAFFDYNQNILQDNASSPWYKWRFQ
jgi:hypothetical protein